MSYRITFKFSKKGNLRFISHLDLMRMLVRAMRRADLPLKITQGFNPHPKLSIKRALKLGVESEAEEASILLNELLTHHDFKERLARQLPEEIQIKSVESGS
ncbi:MAG: hypothetical protein DRP74_05605 [Candidatus Omnitrophota bacterium]|nr:MAG: hypothetical protein DRP74_05605 [Candidatus Omnitrophota bacterium]